MFKEFQFIRSRDRLASWAADVNTEKKKWMKTDRYEWEEEQ